MKLSIRIVLTAALCALAALAPTIRTGAQETGAQEPAARQRVATRPEPRASAKQIKEASKKADSAARVFEQIMGAPDRSIPKDLLDRAEAVAVFPGMLKAGLVVGGRGGSGIISRRVTGGWSAPAFFKMGGASVGLQIGAAKTDLVLLFMNADALKGLMGDKFELGGEAEAAAGPVGRAAGASTNARMTAGIITYSRSKGAFLGVSLKGVAITPDNDLNEAFYGKKASELIESRADANPPSAVRAFPLALARYSVRLPN